jgi:hypothetical protein
MREEHERSQPFPLKMRSLRRIEHPRVLDNRREAIEAGNFLKTSGLSDDVIQFYESHLKSMPLKEMEIELIVDPTILGEDLTQSVNATMVLKWTDPEFLQRLLLTVTAGRSVNGDKYVSASLSEIAHFKRQKVDNHPQVVLINLGKNFKFSNPVSEENKVYYKEWLSDKILNFGSIEDMLGPIEDKSVIWTKPGLTES